MEGTSFTSEDKSRMVDQQGFVQSGNAGMPNDLLTPPMSGLQTPMLTQQQLAQDLTERELLMAATAQVLNQQKQSQENELLLSQNMMAAVVDQQMQMNQFGYSSMVISSLQPPTTLHGFHQPPATAMDIQQHNPFVTQMPVEVNFGIQTSSIEDNSKSQLINTQQNALQECLQQLGLVVSNVSAQQHEISQALVSLTAARDEFKAKSDLAHKRVEQALQKTSTMLQQFQQIHHSITSALAQQPSAICNSALSPTLQQAMFTSSSTIGIGLDAPQQLENALNQTLVAPATLNAMMQQGTREQAIKDTAEPSVCVPETIDEPITPANEFNPALPGYPKLETDEVMAEPQVATAEPVNEQVKCIDQPSATLSHAPTNTKWTVGESVRLKQIIDAIGIMSGWESVAELMGNRTATECKKHWAKNYIRHGKWTVEEDEQLREAFTNTNGVLEATNRGFLVNDEDAVCKAGFWSKVAESIPYRTASQCAARYTESLDPNVNKGKWSQEEDANLKEGYSIHGPIWVKVASCVPGRTQRQCRTRWMFFERAEKLKRPQTNTENDEPCDQTQSQLVDVLQESESECASDTSYYEDEGFE